MSSRLCIILIWIAVAALLGVGLIMVTSTSVWTVEGSDYNMLKKQSLFAGVGLVGALCISCIDYNKIRPYIWWILGFTVVLLLMCYVPGIRKGINGEFRWIGIGGLRCQPSECAKIVMIMVLAHWYAEHKEQNTSLIKGFLIPAALFGIPLALILFEKDMGTALALGVAGFCVMYAAGAKILYLGLSALAGAGGFFLMVTSNENRLNRIKAFLDLEENRLGYGLQQWRGLMALSNGGIGGVGLGNGAEKHGYLPYAHTDFIFAPMGEELGMYGTMSVLLAFGLIVLLGIILALQIKDFFGRLLCIGIVFIIFWPAMLNIGVVTACLPNSGLPLPFISYGGTNLIFTLGAIGLLTSIQRWSVAPAVPVKEPLKRRSAEDSSNNIRL